MEIGGWVAQNWFNFLSATGIIGSLWFAAISLRSEEKTRRIANLLTLTENHRELLAPLYANADLARIFDASADIASLRVNRAEEMYVTALIQHLSSVYRAMQSDLTLAPEGLKADVREFFALPIPKAVWKQLKPLQDADFVAFVDGCTTS